MKMFLLVLTAVLSLAISPIRQVCNDQNLAPLEKAKTLEDLQSAVCRLQNNSRNNLQNSVQLTRDITEIIARLKQNQRASNDWRNNRQLNLALGHLTEKLSENPAPEESQANNPLKESLQLLYSRYNTWEQRQADKPGYIALIKRAIMQTSDGPRLSSCFLDATSHTTSGQFGEDTNSSGKPAPGYGGNMGFILSAEIDPTANKLTKAMIVDYGSSPIVAVAAIAHEYQHACNAEANVDCQNERLSPVQLTHCSQMMAIDEIRAYQMGSRISNELAEASPNLVCSRAFVSGAYGQLPIYFYEFSASNEEKIESGDFPRHIVDLYAKLGDYNFSDFYLPARAGQKREFRRDFIEKVQQAGYKINP